MLESTTVVELFIDQKSLHSSGVGGVGVADVARMGVADAFMLSRRL